MYEWQLCKFLGDFWAFLERDIFFSKDRLMVDGFGKLKLEVKN